MLEFASKNVPDSFPITFVEKINPFDYSVSKEVFSFFFNLSSHRFLIFYIFLHHVPLLVMSTKKIFFFLVFFSKAKRSMFTDFPLFFLSFLLFKYMFLLFSLIRLICKINMPFFVV